MRLTWSARAKRDVREIGTYIAKENRTAAVTVVKRIAATATSLLDFPLVGHAGRVPGTREMPVTGTPYIIVYRVNTRAVRIAAVMHGSRAWPDTF